VLLQLLLRVPIRVLLSLVPTSATPAHL